LGDYLLYTARAGAWGRQEEVVPKERSKVGSLPVIESNAAGIDIGATQIFVAVPPNRDPEPVRCFPTFTVDLERLADWLQQCQIRTVAMESTGVYWIPLFQILEIRINWRNCGMVTTRQEYDATIFQQQKQRRRQQKSTRLFAQARELGFHLVPINSVP
jgi:hypothetical protein